MSYSIIYADPPWDYKGQKQHGGEGSEDTGGAEVHYPTVTLDRLKRLQVKAVCAPGEHSAKPEEVRTRIEQMFPTQRKLELFARKPSPGWDVWGNEVESNVLIPWG